MIIMPIITEPQCTNGGGVLTYWIDASEIKDIQVNEKGEISKFIMKRKGNYGGVYRDRKWNKYPPVFEKTNDTDK